MQSFKQQQKRYNYQQTTTTGIMFSIMFGLLLCLQLFATVASVPTSVLAQNSEVTTNMMNLNGNAQRNNNKQQQQQEANQQQPNAFNTMMNKVKRSSNNDATTTNPNMALDKKSSPEIVPASYNAPSAAREQQQQQLQQDMAQPTLTAAVYTLPTNNEIIAAVEAAAAAAALNQRELEQRQSQFYGNMNDVYDGHADDLAMQPHKRGINAQQYLYDNIAAGGYPGDYYNPYLSAPAAGPVGVAMMPVNDPNLVAIPNGYWSDDDTGIVYADLQDLNDHMPAMRGPNAYRSKAYDNLQSLLNSEAYLESAAAAGAAQPLQYPTSHYYSTLDDTRNKRNSNSKYNNKYADLRLKRDTKLTPADMLALVALVEAGERARHDDAFVNDDSDALLNNYNPYVDGGYNKNNYQPLATATGYDYAAPIIDDTAEYATGAWFEPNYNANNNNNNNNNMDYYGIPMSAMDLPAREHAAYNNLNNYNGNNNKYGSANAKYGSGGNKRYMVAKRKRSLGKFLNEPVAKPSVAYTGEKYY